MTKLHWFYICTILCIALHSDLNAQSINFLTKSEGKKAILDETHEPYFSIFEKLEISAFIQEEIAETKNIEEARDYARKKFSAAVINFTKDEKECITYTVNHICSILEKEGLTIIANQPWIFIKAEDWLCGGFPHTRGNNIILSSRAINYLGKAWSKNMSEGDKKVLVTRFGSIVLHEQMHVLQRVHKDKFSNLYTNYWNFIQADVDNEPIITKNKVTNPDAPITEWLIPNIDNKETYIWIRSQFKDVDGIPKMGRDFINEVYLVSKIDNKYKVLRDSENNLITKSIYEIPFHTTSYPTRSGLEHPNELSAYMFADYFISIVMGDTPFINCSKTATNNSNKFIEWINTDLK